MKMNKYEKLYCKAMVKFGAANQLVIAVEELSELQKEVTKFIRKNGNKANLTEEIADVEIMLEQIKMICSVNQKEVEEYKDMKIKRLEETLNK